MKTRYQQLTNEYLDAYAKCSATKLQRYYDAQDAFHDDPNAVMSTQLRRDLQIFQFQMTKKLSREFGIEFVIERRNWQMSKPRPPSALDPGQRRDWLRFLRAVARHAGIPYKRLLRLVGEVDAPID